MTWQEQLLTVYCRMELLALYAQDSQNADLYCEKRERLDKAIRRAKMEERGWVTINGKHVFIGEDGGSSGGGSDSGGQEGSSEQSGDKVPYYAGLKDKLSAIKDKIKDKVTPEKYKEASQEYLDSLPKLSEPESMEQALSAVNPKGYANNCQRCVPAYEMRRRGYAVTAADAPSNPLEDNIGLGDYKKVFVGAKWTTCQGSGKEEIAAYLKSCGDGARVKITIDTDRGNHIFVAEQSKKATKFIDPQKGTNNADKYFQMRLTAKTKFCRIDNLAVSNLIKDCIER